MKKQFFWAIAIITYLMLIGCIACQTGTISEDKRNLDKMPDLIYAETLSTIESTSVENKYEAEKIPPNEMLQELIKHDKRMDSREEKGYRYEGVDKASGYYIFDWSNPGNGTGASFTTDPYSGDVYCMGTRTSNIFSNTTEDTESEPCISGNSNSVSALSNEDFIIKGKDTYIELGERFSDLRTKERTVTITPPNQNHAYSIYNYENFRIITNVISIFEVDLTTSCLQTSRGIKIGDSITEVYKMYGVAKVSDHVNMYYMYIFRDRFITFCVDKNDKVTCIQFELI